MERATPHDGEMSGRSASRRWVVHALLFLPIPIVLFLLTTRRYGIPTPVMENTVMTGDHVLVSLLHYGMRVGSTRLPGFDGPKVDDLMVFNFPQGDTVVIGYPNPDYYQWSRIGSRDRILRELVIDLPRPGTTETSPVRIEGIETHAISEREPRLARCIAGPDDTLLIKAGTVHLNGQFHPAPEMVKFDYEVELNGALGLAIMRERFGIDEATYQSHEHHGTLPLRPAQEEAFRSLKQVESLERQHDTLGLYHSGDGMFWPIFPNDSSFNWTTDELGPLWIPKAGATIQLDARNLTLYGRAINAYEGHAVSRVGDQVLIDGQPANTYTFRQDYYWAMGDNRHRSQDSRYYGFVPFDHVIGKVIAVY